MVRLETPTVRMVCGPGQSCGSDLAGASSGNEESVGPRTESLAGHLDGVVGFTKTHEGEWCPCGQGVGMKRIWLVASEHEIDVETRQ